MENAIVLTAAVLGIVQAFKIAGLPTKYSPIVAILVGAVMYVAVAGISPEHIVTGVVIGLSAVGLYESGSRVGDKAIISPQEKEVYKDLKRK
ncbi:MAG: hypothetical protein ACLVLI_02595 [Aedoeadaptatus pacaensis]